MHLVVMRKTEGKREKQRNSFHCFGPDLDQGKQAVKSAPGIFCDEIMKLSCKT